MTDALEDLRDKVRQRFTNTARFPDREQKFPVGPASAKKLGYDAERIDHLPSSVTDSFCGVGNPLGLGQPRAGQTVLDLGSGAGLDSMLAARAVGSKGRVVGVDMTAAMVDKARRNAAALGIAHVTFLHGRIDALPLADDGFDLVICNGAFNLCPQKPQVLGEIFRVLRPGGRLQMADILLHDDVSPEEVAKKGTWSD